MLGQIASGSHHELRKLNTRISLILEATRKAGGIYLYANQIGCDGDRLYCKLLRGLNKSSCTTDILSLDDGSAMIIVNGLVVAINPQFSLNEVEVLTATIDLEDVRTFRCSPSRGLQAQSSTKFRRLEIPTRLSKSVKNPELRRREESNEIEIRYHSPEEEISLGAACWLWDYLRRSGVAGYFVPLSGGIDSCATSVLVFSMCRLVHEAACNGNEQVIKDARRIAGEPEDSQWKPGNPEEFW